MMIIMMNLKILTVILSMDLAFAQYIEVYLKNNNEFNRNEASFYTFRYYVDDPSSGTVYDHWEDRKGDHVIGRYGLVEPDGNVRTVYYEVNGKSGFRSAIKTRRSAVNQSGKYFVIERQQPKYPVIYEKPVAFIL